MSEQDTTPVTEAPATFTQEQVNAINAADRRKDRERIAALEADITALRDKANKLDAIEAESMTAAEKLAAERDAALATAADLKARVEAAERAKAAEAAALKVASELGVPTEAALKLAGRISGDDPEAMEADARDVLGLITPRPAPAPAAADDVLKTAGPSNEAEYLALSQSERAALLRSPEGRARVEAIFPTA